MLENLKQKNLQKMVLKLEPETKLFRAAALRPAAVTGGFT